MTFFTTTLAIDIAIVLLIAIAFAHSYLGERLILTRLFKRDNLPHLFGSDDFTKRTLRFAWHITSVAWLGFAAILWSLNHGEFTRNQVAFIIALTFAIHGLISLIGAKGKHFSWVVFLAISGLVLVAAN